MMPVHGFKRWLRLTLILAALAAVSARADATSGPSVAGVPFSGRIYADIYAPIQNTETSPYHYVGSSFWLQADPKLGDKSSARAILQSDALDTTVTGQTLRTYLREGYVTMSDQGWEIRAGKQIIPWGKSDAINPTDLISAKDYTVFNPDEEVRRVGQTSVQVNYTPLKGASPFTFTGILTPAFPQSKVLFNPAQVPGGISLNLAPTIPNLTLFNTEAALKAAYSGSGWDADAIFFRGFNHMPEFYQVSGTTFGQTFHRITATGGDFSFTSGKFIFRGETAYVWTEDQDGSTPEIIPTHWDTVVGVERAFGSDFRLQVQGVLRYIPNYTAPDQATGPNPLQTVINQQLAAANALVLNYQFRTQPSATARFGYQNDSNGIDAEIFLLYSFKGGDYLARPKVSYSWTDALKTTIGIDWYAGPTDHTLGSLSVYNSLFLEAKYSF